MMERRKAERRTAERRVGDVPRVCFSCGRTVDSQAGVEVGGRLYCPSCSVSRLLAAAKEADDRARPATVPPPLRLPSLRRVLLAVVVALLLLQGILTLSGAYHLPPPGAPPREAMLSTAPTTVATDGALAALWELRGILEAHRLATGSLPERLDLIPGQLPGDPLGVGFDYLRSADGGSYSLAVRDPAAYGVRRIGCDERGTPRVEP